MADPISLTIIIPHTKPIMPVISGFQHTKFTIPDDERTKKVAEKIFHLNNSIFIKAEFAKTAFRIIETCYSKYGTKVEGGYMIKPDLFFPAWREVDNLIFELGSILDFFAREINILYKLDIPLRSVSFSRVVEKCESQRSDEKITTTLTGFHNSELHKYFREMRNRVTHRLPFVLKGMNNQIYFPDDPNDDEVSPKTDAKIDIYHTCRDWLYGILDFIDNTSVLVLSTLGKITPYDKEGSEITIEEYIRRHRKELEERLSQS